MFLKCCLFSMFVLLLNSYVEILTLKVMVFYKRWRLWEVVMRVELPWMRLVPFTRPQRAPSPPVRAKDKEVSYLHPGKKPPAPPHLALWSWTLASRTMKNRFLLFISQLMVLCYSSLNRQESPEYSVRSQNELHVPLQNYTWTTGDWESKASYK